MKYISTRGSKKEYSFTEAFLLSYAEDGGLFCPKEISPVSPQVMEEWSVFILFSNKK
jgi:threonine synthase